MNLGNRRHRLLRDVEPGGAPPKHGSGRYGREASFDSNMVIILAALLCTLICVLGINSIVRCVLRRVGRMSALDAAEEHPQRLAGKRLNKVAMLWIPVAVYGSEDRFGSTECLICLGEFLDGEKIRVLPKCHHCFHVKCVDVWLASHSSCPTCRQTVEEEPAESGGEVVVEDHAAPTGSVEEVG